MEQKNHTDHHVLDPNKAVSCPIQKFHVEGMQLKFRTT